MAPDIAWAVVMGRRFVGVWSAARAAADRAWDAAMAEPLEARCE